MPPLAPAVGDGEGNRRGVVNGSAVTLRSSPALCPQHHQHPPVTQLGPQIHGVRAVGANPKTPIPTPCWGHAAAHPHGVTGGCSGVLGALPSPCHICVCRRLPPVSLSVCPGAAHPRVAGAVGAAARVNKELSTPAPPAASCRKWGGRAL